MKKRISNSNVIISAGGSHTVGLRSDGAVLAAGCKLDNICDVGSWRDVVSVSAGLFHTAGLRSDGTVLVTESDRDHINQYGHTAVGDWRDIKSVYALSRLSVWKQSGRLVCGGLPATIGLRSDGTVKAVGHYVGEDEINSWSSIVAVAEGAAHIVGLRSDGTVVAFVEAGYNWHQCDVSSWTDIVAIAAGGAHTVGVRPDGTVVAVGNNEYGQCDVSDWNLD